MKRGCVNFKADIIVGGKPMHTCVLYRDTHTHFSCQPPLLFLTKEPHACSTNAHLYCLCAFLQSVTELPKEGAVCDQTTKQEL